MATITSQIEPKVTSEMEDKHFPIFEKQAMHKGNGVYSIAGLYSICTRELFLMFVAQKEGIPYDSGENIEDSDGEDIEYVE